MSLKAKISNRSLILGAGALGGVLAGAFALSPMATPPADAQPIVIQQPAGAPMSFADLIEQVSPAVVSVQVVTEVDAQEQYGELFDRFRGIPGFEDFLERHGDPDEEENSPREGRSLGSGFFISAEGHIVTNNHVVEDATEVTVTMNNGDELEAELIGTDPETDLAVLKVKQSGPYKYVSFNTDARPRVGDWVVAVGNPFGLGGTATAGIVSADGRELGGNYNDFIQIDASINRGNSGGPTFDLSGRVIGVNTQIISPTGGSVGIGFAIEAASAKLITDKLITDGKVSRGWLGVTIQNVTPEAAEALGLTEERGAQVAEVVPGGPADKAGLERSDIILAVNGADVDTSRELTQEVGGLLAGTTNAFKVYRDGGVKMISVTVGERPTDLASIGNLEEDDSELSPEDQSGSKSKNSSTKDDYVFGMGLKPVDETARKSLGLSAEDAGLYVESIERHSVLADAGIEQGDVILEAQGDRMVEPADLEEVVAAAEKAGRQNLLMAIRKGRQTGFITVDLEELSALGAN